MKKHTGWWIAVGLAATVAMTGIVPMIASADATATVAQAQSLESQISALLQQVGLLRTQLYQVLGTSTASGSAYSSMGSGMMSSRPPLQLDSFTQCIASTTTTLYCASGSPDCARQKAFFGSSAQYLPYVECSEPTSTGATSTETQACVNAGVQSYPTWSFPDGSTSTGVLGITVLAEKTGCALPSSTGERWMNGSTTPPSAITLSMGTSTSCFGLNRNLSQGSRGDDVSELQQFLSQDPSVYPQGSVTGYYGTSTANAVIRFQRKYGIASSSAGYVGPLTRKFFSERCLPPPMNASGTMTDMGGRNLGMPFIPYSSSSENWMQRGASSTASGTPPYRWHGMMRPGQFGTSTPSGTPPGFGQPYPPQANATAGGPQGGMPPPSQQPGGAQGDQ